MKNYLSISLLIITSIAYGQRNSIGVNIKVYDPISKFRQNVDHSVPAGLSFTYMRGMEDSRYSFGGELGVAMYSNNDYYIEHNGRNIKVSEEDCFWTLHGVVRYDVYRTDRFASYIEGRAGITTFFSSTVAEDPDSDYDGEFNFHGTAFNTGLGGGVLVRVGSNIWINGGVNVHSGSKTDYRYMPESDQAISLDEGQYKSLTHYMG